MVPSERRRASLNVARPLGPARVRPPILAAGAGAVGAASALGVALEDPAAVVAAPDIGISDFVDNAAAVAVLALNRAHFAVAAVGLARALLERAVASLERAERIRAARVRDGVRVRRWVGGAERREEAHGEEDGGELHCGDAVLPAMLAACPGGGSVGSYRVLSCSWCIAVLRCGDVAVQWSDGEARRRMAGGYLCSIPSTVCQLGAEGGEMRTAEAVVCRTIGEQRGAIRRSRWDHRGTRLEGLGERAVQGGELVHRDVATALRADTTRRPRSRRDVERNSRTCIANSNAPIRLFVAPVVSPGQLPPHRR